MRSRADDTVDCGRLSRGVVLLALAAAFLGVALMSRSLTYADDITPGEVQCETISDGNWTDGSNWDTRPTFPDNGITYYTDGYYPGGQMWVQAGGIMGWRIVTSDVWIYDTIALDADIGAGNFPLINRLFLDGTLTGSGNLRVAYLYGLGGTMEGSGTTVVFQGGSASLTINRLVQVVCWDRLTLNGGGTGNFEVSPQTDLCFDGYAFSGSSIVNDGLLTLQNARISGPCTISGGGRVDIWGGPVDFSGDPQLACPVNFYSGTLDGTVTIPSFCWGGGVIAGTVIIPAGSTADASGYGILQGNLINNGGLVIRGVTGDYGTLYNQAGALCEVDGSLFRTRHPTWEDPGFIVNVGTMTAWGPIEWNLSNDGLFQVVGECTLSGGFVSGRHGTIEVNGWLTIVPSQWGNGLGGQSFIIDSGSEVLLNGGSRTFCLGGTSFANDGVVRFVSGANILFDSPATFAGSGEISVVNSTVTADVDLLLSGLFTLNDSVLQGVGTVTMPSLAWTNATMAGSGVTVIPSGGSLVVRGPQNVQVRTVENYGTSVFVESAVIGARETPAAPTFNNHAGATCELQGVCGLYSGWSAPPGTFNNAGTLLKTGPGTTQIDWVFNNTGVVEVEEGTLRLSGGGSDSGAFEVSSDAGLWFSGGHSLTGASWTIDGTLIFRWANATFSGPSTFSGNGGVNIADSTVAFGADLSSGGPVPLNGAISIVNSTVTADADLLLGGPVTLTESTLQGVGTVTMPSLAWTNATMAGSGVTVIPSGGSLVVRGPQNVQVRTVENYGTSVFVESAVTGARETPAAPTFNNHAGATCELQGVCGLYSGWSSPPGMFNNAGTLLKKGVGTTQIDWVFNNSGGVEVQEGTLVLGGPVTQLSGGALTGGTWGVYANSTLILSGGDITTNWASVTLGGPNAVFANLNALAANEGNLTLLDGRQFATAASLSNSGNLTIGQGSKLTVTGVFTQTGGSTTVDGAFQVAGSVADILGGVASFNSDLGSEAAADLTLNVSDAAVHFGSSQHLAALSVGAAAAQLAPGGGKVLVTRTLAVGPGSAVLDVTDNALTVDYPDTGPSPLADVAGWIRSGYRDGPGGCWDGPGIASSVAAADAGFLTAVGVLDNSDPVAGGKATFAGETVDATSVLVTYTYWGDVNLDGVVDADDYDIIDRNFLFPPTPANTGWWTGDFTYDGAIDANDYDRIDRVFLFQGAPLTGGGAVPTPEPATLAIVGLGGLGMLLRRRARGA